MRLLLLLLIVIAGTLPAQTPTPTPIANPPRVAGAALTSALLGHWTGVLEYRDYSEPATSTKRVQLPTWLTIKSAPEGLFLDYTYDDGPAKTVVGHNVLVLDAEARTYKIVGTDAVAETYAMTNLDQLQNGRGTLVLSGPGKENNQPVDVRTTWIIRRNLLSWLEEVRPAGSSDSFSFRHRYIFTRAEVPLPATAPAK